MKNLYSISLSLIVAASTIPGAAQQLTNPGFEEAWVNCIPWTSTGNTTAQGTTPTGWNASNTIGTGSMGKMTLVSTTAGYNSTSAAEIANKEYSFIGIKKNIPGYLTLGTPWSTAQGTSANNKDGGTFGGIEFGYRPDALTFMYKSTGSADQPTVVAYSWKGTYTQADVPGDISMGNPTKISMVDRDRNILGVSTDQGGAVTASDGAARIATINQRLVAEQANWTPCTLPFEYTGTQTPEKFNVIFAAGDYFTSDPTKNVSITVDDVKLLYYSRLATLSVSGTPVEGFNSDKYSYTINSEMPAESAFAYTCLGNSGSGVATLSLDTENAVATITVTNANAGGTDIDGKTSHVYTLQFNKATTPDTPNVPEGALTYTGTLTVDIEMMGIHTETAGEKVYVLNSEDGNTCTFMLFNFKFEDIEVGNIVLENVSVTNEADGSGKYYAHVDHMLLGPDTDADGNPVPDDQKIDANVTLEGTIDQLGKAVMTINVEWNYDGTQIPIKVLFNGDGPGYVAGIEDVWNDTNDSAVEYYNIQGMRVSESNLTPGLYIIRKGNETKKVYIK